MSSAQNPVPASQIVHNVKRMQNLGSVLYIAAHPDDENTRLIAYLTKEERVDVSYLSLTRGDGGQNLIGTEIGPGLGLIRTNELLEARKLDGASQYFTRAIDFGYSKTPAETFNFWSKEEVLSDVVWVIRNTRPDVIITRFSPEENPNRPTHGHHTASAQLALEAFDAAADPNRFPEQLEFVEIWQAIKIVWNTSYWFYGSVEKMDAQVALDPDKYYRIDANAFLPTLGTTCSHISAASRSKHKSQGFGSAPVIGEQIEYLEHLKGFQKDGEDIWSNIPTSWTQRYGQKSIEKSLTKLISKFNDTNPAASLPELLKLKRSLNGLDDDPFIHKKKQLLDDIIMQCLGYEATAFVKEQFVTSGQVIDVDVNIASHAAYLGFKVTGILSKMTNAPSIPAVKEGHVSLQFKLTIPSDLTMSQPYWLSEEQSAGMYGTSNQLQRGQAMGTYPFVFTVECLVDGEKIELNLPIYFSTTDPVKGQLIQPIIVQPHAMVNLEKDVYIFADSKPKELRVNLISGVVLNGYVELILPKGYVSEPRFFKVNNLAANDQKFFVFKVSTSGQSIGNEVVKAIFKTNTNVYATGVQKLAYDHIPNWAMFPTAEAKLTKLNIQIKGNKVGYVVGAGDKVPESLMEMGYQVTLLTTDDINQNKLDEFHAIMLGIRALNTLENINSCYSSLMLYVNNGGTLVMQYNTSHRLKVDSIGPYPIHLSHNRVTEENAEVRFLLPDHPVLNKPNKLTQADFDNWVQERGLYFPDTFDAKYKAVLGMNDTGEDNLNSSLLIAQYGKGYFVYTGLSFFRELPAGVPGSYRLMANILSLGQ